MRQTKRAFKWIVSILERRKVPFQISGGLAAKAYGSSRKLVDIDIDIPKDKFADIIAEVKSYIVRGPKRYKDKNWDVFLMTLKYANQKIDISGVPTKRMFDKKEKRWVDDRVSFSKKEIKKIFGIYVPVITRQRLIESKKKLSRRVDKIDVESITNKN